jgi:hypothetical protein
MLRQGGFGGPERDRVAEYDGVGLTRGRVICSIGGNIVCERDGHLNVVKDIYQVQAWRMERINIARSETQEKKSCHDEVFDTQQ